MAATGWLAVGAVGAALAVAAGAFGAHGLASRLDPRSLELWETAARYLMYGSLGTLVVGLAQKVWPGGAWSPAGWGLAVGSLVFFSTVAALALGGPGWLGAVTPVGGALLIFGFVWLAWVAIRLPS